MLCGHDKKSFCLDALVHFHYQWEYARVHHSSVAQEFFYIWIVTCATLLSSVTKEIFHGVRFWLKKESLEFLTSGSERTSSTNDLAA